MSAVESAVVFLPRFTTLAGAGTFTTAPLDVSRHGSIQFQLYRAAMLGTNPTFQVFLEESLDCESWVLGPSTATGYDPGAGNSKYFGYAFRLRWFRLRIVLGGTGPMVTCWAEGLLRDGGGGGEWPAPGAAPGRALARGIAAPAITAGVGAGAAAGEPGGREAGTPPWAQTPSNPFENLRTAK